MVMSDGELSEVGLWSDKAKAAKGGFVGHQVGNVAGMKKICCDKMMGEKCDCEPNPTFNGHKEKRT